MKDKNDFLNVPKEAPHPFPTPSQPLPSFKDILGEVKAQVEYASFEYRDRALLGELCSIIAEIYWLSEREEGYICVDGARIPYSLAAEVYRDIGARHVEYVIDYYKSVSYRIRSAKAYLRAALYNSVFKLEHDTENEYRRERGSGA